MSKTKTVTGRGERDVHLMTLAEIEDELKWFDGQMKWIEGERKRVTRRLDQLQHLKMIGYLRQFELKEELVRKNLAGEGHPALPPPVDPIPDQQEDVEAR
jgi:hypothetical protein